jgi:hypothetical protein
MSKKSIERLKFYCDTDKEKNKLMTWSINSIFDLETRIKYWMKKVVIRSAWYEVVEEGKVVSNQRIDLEQFTATNFTDISFIKQ